MPRVPGASTYVPLVADEMESWLRLERDSREKLMIPVGGLAVGAFDGNVVRETLESHDAAHVPYEILNPSEVTRRFPMFLLRNEEVGVWDSSTAVLRVEPAIAAQLRLAAEGGATIRTDEPVRSWSVGTGGVEVVTSRARFQAERLVLASGGWAGDLLDGILNLRSERQVIAWFRPTVASFEPGACPMFLLETPPPNDFVYGTPDVDGAGVRLATHRGGTIAHPDAIERMVSDEDLFALEAVVESRLTGLAPKAEQSDVCFYPHSPDQRFCIGVHPYHSEVIIAVGSSGHGYQFSQVVGESVTELVRGGYPDHLRPFDPARFISTTHN